MQLAGQLAPAQSLHTSSDAGAAIAIADVHAEADSTARVTASTHRTRRLRLPPHSPESEPLHGPNGPTSHCGTTHDDVPHGTDTVVDTSTVELRPHCDNGTAEKPLLGSTHVSSRYRTSGVAMTSSSFITIIITNARPWFDCV